MASSMLHGAENLAIVTGRVAPNGLGFTRSDLNGRKFSPKVSLVCGNSISTRKSLIMPKCSMSVPRPASQPRFIQHKKEAFWFYRFLSIVYDNLANPGHYTEDMRDEALEPVDLSNRDLVVVDVGGGTGFTTSGIVKYVDAKNVTILDQSPHQLAKARQKEPLKECKIIEGDAEDLPFPTDYADRYVSAGSIEYWPDPQRGIKEAYRVLKIGGKACIIGPVYPTYWLARFFADLFMLFPKEEEYIEWFTKAGFKDVQIKRIGPKWYRGVRRYGLIIGCSVTGVKPASGDSPLQLGPKVEDVKKPVNPFVFLARFLTGVLAGAYYVLVPVYMWLKDQIVPKGIKPFDFEQVVVGSWFLAYFVVHFKPTSLFPWRTINPPCLAYNTLQQLDTLPRRIVKLIRFCKIPSSCPTRKNIFLSYIEDMLLSNIRTLKNIENMPYPNAERTIDGNNRRYVFVYGYGGTGETYLYKTMTVAESVVINEQYFDQQYFESAAESAVESSSRAAESRSRI
ncbi:MPBQ/MSBQ methyltransferase 2 [Artemisia annua]|uniref:MPBQ/MSBQ methyltransferase 2 n=1 Tax=Artemisia annua TaxID=35608 RepID=A0A2U1NG00_ARTAN|nr:MPBQ/MSBQ methyltransferase 2 [Artemisia annua]